MSTYKDLDKRRETQRKWREKNREKLRAYYKEKYGAEYKKKWRDEKPGQREADRKRRKEYYERNREEELKRAREYMRGWHARNKEKRQAYSREKYAKDKQWFKEFLSQQKCAHCEMTDIECFEFHHKEPKGRENGKRVDPTITSMLCHSKKRIMAEIAKCIVLCANCHRKEHARLKREN